jgi:hypothetical protein
MAQRLHQKFHQKSKQSANEINKIVKFYQSVKGCEEFHTADSVKLRSAWTCLWHNGSTTSSALFQFNVPSVNFSWMKLLMSHNIETKA